MKSLSLALSLVAALTWACQNDDCSSKSPSPDCICTMDYNPVCGCDDVTYSNACMAECHGIEEYTQGACAN